MRIALSYFDLEWWYRHLAEALAGTCATAIFNPPHASKPGYEFGADIRTLLEQSGGMPDAYLGSVGALFRGITDLPVPTAIWSDYIPGNEPYIPGIRLFDLVLATQKDSVPLLKQAGIRKVEWMPYAFDDSLPNHPAAPKEFDAAFVGSLEQPATSQRRRAVLAALEPICRLNDYRKPCFGPDLFATYNKARMVVNVPVPGGFNMRTFEALGCGALLLTEDVGNGQADLFKDGEHLILYRSIPDLVDKVKYFMAHEEERAGIAKAGMDLVLSQHTYRQRAHTVREMLSSNTERARESDPGNAARAYSFFYRWNRRPDLMMRMVSMGGIPFAERANLLAGAAKASAGLLKRGWA